MHSPPMRKDSYGNPRDWVCVPRVLFTHLLLEAKFPYPVGSRVPQLEFFDSEAD